MNFMSLRTWTGIGFILLFLLNASFFIAGLLLGHLWCILSGVLLVLLQLWLHERFSRVHQFLTQVPELSAHEIELIIGRTQTGADGFSPVGGPSLFGLLNRSVQVCNTQLQIAGSAFFTEIGAGNCRKPYRMNLLNIASFRDVKPDKNSVLALSRGAKVSDCAVNTGVLGIVPELLRGGSDLVWRMDRLEALYRNTDGSFNELKFNKAAGRPYIKMIEVRINAAHFLPDVSEISLNCLVAFLDRLKVLSGGKPTGVCISVTNHELVWRLCRVMAANVVYLDFITIESTAPDPSVAALLNAIGAVRQAVATHGLPTKIIASGNLARERDILQAIGYGAHACYSIHPFRVALSVAGGPIRTTTNNKVAAVTIFHRNTSAAVTRLIMAGAVCPEKKFLN